MTKTEIKKHQEDILEIRMMRWLARTCDRELRGKLKQTKAEVRVVRDFLVDRLVLIQVVKAAEMANLGHPATR